MCNRRLVVLGVVAFVGSGPSGRMSHAGCDSPIAIMHMANGTSNGGAFILPERAGQPNGPEIRYWLYGQYAAANSGRQGQFDAGRLWLIGQAAVPGAEAPSDHFWLNQASWMGPQVVGCALNAPVDSRRTVVELSYLINENQPNHYTGYLIASVAFVSGMDFNFDHVTDGNGGGARVKMVPLPVPQPVGLATANRANPDFMDVQLQIPDARSYGDSGAPNLIAGYEIYYKNDEVPVSSDPAHYLPVKNPQAISSPLGFVPYGVGSVKVAVRTPQTASYFTLRVRYADGTTLISSRGTSANSAAVAPFISYKAKKEEPKATPTPQSADLATPTPVPAEPDASPTEAAESAEAVGARVRATPQPSVTASATKEGASEATTNPASATSVAGVGPVGGFSAQRAPAPASSTAAPPGVDSGRDTPASSGPKPAEFSSAVIGKEPVRAVESGSIGSGVGVTEPGVSGSAQSIPLGGSGPAGNQSKGSDGTVLVGAGMGAKPSASGGESGNHAADSAGPDAGDGPLDSSRPESLQEASRQGVPAATEGTGDSQPARPWLLLDGVVVVSVALLGFLSLAGRR